MTLNFDTTLVFCCFLTVDNPRMQAFIREKTSAPYFSNLVWYMGNHVLELDSCVRHDIE